MAKQKVINGREGGFGFLSPIPYFLFPKEE